MPSPRSQPPRILVASHHTDVALDVQQVAERRGYVVRRAYTGVQLLDQRFTADTDVIVLDGSLPDIEPLDASRALRDDPSVGPGVPILLLSAITPPCAPASGSSSPTRSTPRSSPPGSTLTSS
jgi:CheY-like chemotaxis protein